MNSKQPMKNIDVAIVATKKYLFFVPKKTVGMFFVLNTIKTHKLFEGVDIEQGVKNLIEQSNSLEELESSMIALLENDEKYVHHIEDKKSFKFRGFLGKHTLRMSIGGTNWSSFMLATASPSSIYSPDVGLSKQPSVFIMVDLPEPDGPIMETISPRSIVNETPRKACTSNSPIL